jgi:hypothetical protein
VREVQIQRVPDLQDNEGHLNKSRGGAAAARRTHYPKVVGSIPTPATKQKYRVCLTFAK